MGKVTFGSGLGRTRLHLIEMRHESIDAGPALCGTYLYDAQASDWKKDAEELIICRNCLRICQKADVPRTERSTSTNG